MAEQSEIKGWVAGRVPSEWFAETPEVLVDRDEIVVIGRLADVQASEGGDAQAARAGRVRQYREDTREQRIKISQEAQKKFEKPVSWGARCGEYGELFTHLSVPVMTRLRIRERQLLDALVDAGVARSRSHALAWCVRLVGQHQADWVKELQDAVAKVDALRAQGPKLN